VIAVDVVDVVVLEVDSEVAPEAAVEALEVASNKALPMKLFLWEASCMHAKAK